MLAEMNRQSSEMAGKYTYTDIVNEIEAVEVRLLGGIKL